MLASAFRPSVVKASYGSKTMTITKASKPRMGAALLALILGASGCASSSDSASTDQPAGDSIAPPEATAPELSRAQLTAALGDGESPFVAIDNTISECMTAAGFEWFSTADELESSSSELPDEIFVKQFGYGILIDADVPSPTSQPPDANDSYFAGLSPAQQQAYNVNLTGNPAGNEPSSPNSCAGKAQADAQQISELYASELFVEINEYYSRLVDSDPRVVEAQKEWSLCMKERGFDYTSREEIIRYLLAIQENEGAQGPSKAQIDEELRLADADFSCALGGRDAVAAAQADALDETIARFATG